MSEENNWNYGNDDPADTGTEQQNRNDSKY